MVIIIEHHKLFMKIDTNVRNAFFRHVLLLHSSEEKEIFELLNMFLYLSSLSKHLLLLLSSLLSPVCSYSLNTPSGWPHTADALRQNTWQSLPAD